MDSVPWVFQALQTYLVRESCLYSLYNWTFVDQSSLEVRIKEFLNSLRFFRSGLRED